MTDKLTEGRLNEWETLLSADAAPSGSQGAYNISVEAYEILHFSRKYGADLIAELRRLAEKREAYEAVRTKGTTMIADLTVSLTNARRERDAANMVIHDMIAELWPVKDGGSDTWAGTPVECAREVQRQRDAAHAREAGLREALAYAITKYGAPGGPWNVPSDPGGWLQKARAALATKGE